MRGDGSRRLDNQIAKVYIPHPAELKCVKRNTAGGDLCRSNALQGVQQKSNPLGRTCSRDGPNAHRRVGSTGGKQNGYRSTHPLRSQRRHGRLQGGEIGGTAPRRIHGVGSTHLRVGTPTRSKKQKKNSGATQDFHHKAKGRTGMLTEQCRSILCRRRPMFRFLRLSE